MVIKMNPDAFICGIMGGILGMLLISSAVIAAANSTSRECMVKFSNHKETYVLVGDYK